MDSISVLVVDDSALMRNLVSRMIDQSPDMQVVGKAMNGRFALQKIPQLKPDIIVLDLEMPVMNGLEFLEARRKQGIDIPVVILSSIAQKGARITMDALSMGAADFVTKPSGSVSTDIHVVADQLQALIRAYGGKYARGAGKTLPEPPPHGDDSQAGAPPAQPTAESLDTPPQAQQPPRPAADQAAPQRAAAPRGLPPLTPGALPKRVEVILIGISTGGPNALRKMLAAIDRSCSIPMVIVQHMPAGFTKEFARSLDRICPLQVKEAEDGDRLTPGRILIAPGDKHILLQADSSRGHVRLSDDLPENGHRPSADVMFRSAAAVFGNRCAAFIMTGMGRDGAREIGTLYSKGAITIGQDAASCVVYGMPKVAWDAGYLHKQLSLSHMADAITRITTDPLTALQG